MSVTLDTNAYVSALNFGGREMRLLNMAEAGVLVIDISDHIESELKRVLREDFQWEAYRLKFMLERLKQFTNRVTPTRTVDVVDDPDDDRIIECALAGGSAYIITNDKALLRVANFEGIQIVKPDEYFALGRQR
jgi:putative PIN family toxin of toxin-antitoxin system